MFTSIKISMMELFEEIVNAYCIFTKSSTIDVSQCPEYASECLANSLTRIMFNRITLLKKRITLLKRRIWHRCFPVNFAKFLTTSFLKENLWWLLLKKKFSKLLKFSSCQHIFYYKKWKRQQNTLSCRKNNPRAR